MLIIFYFFDGEQTDIKNVAPLDLKVASESAGSDPHPHPLTSVRMAKSELPGQCTGFSKLQHWVWNKPQLALSRPGSFVHRPESHIGPGSFVHRIIMTDT